MKVLAMVLAGGQGSRLDPLTAQRSKPAIPVLLNKASSFGIIEADIEGHIRGFIEKL